MNVKCKTDRGCHSITLTDCGEQKKSDNSMEQCKGEGVFFNKEKKNVYNVLDNNRDLDQEKMAYLLILQ